MGHHPGWMNDFTGTVGRHHLVYTYIGASKIMWASNHMSVIIVGSGPMSWWHSRQSHAPLDLHKLFYMFIMCSQILVQLWFLAIDHWALSGTHIPYAYHKSLKLRVCKWRVLVITDGRLVANACMYMKYNCSCARCSTCVCLLRLICMCVPTLRGRTMHWNMTQRTLRQGYHGSSLSTADPSIVWCSTIHVWVCTHMLS